jgi:hypothetical protein
MIAKVDVEYHSGLSVSSRKMLRPVVRMFTAYAGKVKYRIQTKKRLGSGRQTGRYVPVKTTLNKAEKNLAIARNQKNKKAISLWLNTIDNINANRGGRRRGYRSTGGMWRGFKVKAQQSGKTITVGFFGKSKARPGGKKTVTNRAKAWFAFTDSGKHREGEHMLAPTKDEFDALKAHYALNVTAGMLTEVKERQKIAAMIKKGMKQDPKLKSILDQYLSK